jgi:dipicolinate synthase subunit A
MSSINTQKNIVFVGGDARQITAARMLSLRGWRVSTFLGGDFDVAFERYESLESALMDADTVVLPLPVSVDAKSLNAPFLENEQIALSRIVDALSQKQTVIGGRIPEDMVRALGDKGITVIDYFKSEAFQIENAYTTSEAALSIAMNNLKRNIRGARFAVMGYGRIARTLTELLIKLGGKVCVLARKESDLAWARIAGAKVMRITSENIKRLADGYDIIFNTVPSWLFFEEFLLRVDKNTLIIDLASSPGGVDVSAAKKLNSRVLWASSLPGKYAPESAGELIADCIGDIISEGNV